MTSRSRPLRVVIVDDAADLRLLVRYVLQLDDAFEVVGEAADGAEGVEVATREQPDLVLLDLSMPDMDGLEALPLIQQAVPHVTVVVLSGFSAHSMARRAMDLGAAGYLEKGVPASELLDNLRELLELGAEGVGSGEAVRRLAGGGPSSRP